MTDRFCSLSTEGAVTVLRVDRPPANALDPELLGELGDLLDSVAADPPAALVLAGRERFFSAGADLKAVAGLDAAGHRTMVQGINRMVLGVYGLPCPVVAAVTGHAIAGGFVLAMCADHRVASPEGKYGLTEIKVGVPYPVAAMGVLVAELDARTVRALTLSSRLVDSAWCERRGIFDEVVEPDAVIGRAVELAAELATQPAAAYAYTKRQLREEPLDRMRTAVDSDPLLGGWVEDASAATQVLGS